MSGLLEEVARKLGVSSEPGRNLRAQSDLALAERRRLPLAALKGLAQAGLAEQEIARFVIPQRGGVRPCFAATVAASARGGRGRLAPLVKAADEVPAVPAAGSIRLSAGVLSAPEIDAGEAACRRRRELNEIGS